MKRLHLYIFAVITLFSVRALDAGPQRAHKVALVLSGGGARGASHVGVLKVLEQAHIRIDCITGTSFGAMAGGLYAIGYSTSDIEKILSGQDWNSIFRDAPERRLTPLIERRNSRYQAQISFRGALPELPTGLRRGQRLTESLDLLTTSRMLRAEYDFDRLPVQFRAVATNLVDGRAYIFRRGSLTEALRASMAIPLLFTPLEKDDMLLVDGGLADNLPTDVASDLGADIIIAVDATSPLLTKDQIRNLFNVADQSISLQMERNVRVNRQLASIVLQPRLENFSYNDYSRIRDIIKVGEEEATRLLPKIKALLAGVEPRPAPSAPPPASPLPTIESISFSGLKRIQPAQLMTNVRVHPGDAVDPNAIDADVKRLYGTSLFETVGFDLKPLSGGRYQLVYLLQESPLNSVGVALRYDSDYKFVALAEFTARELFGSPSTAIVSTQFGGLEDHFALLRLVPSPAPFLFLEPRGEVLRLERLDIRDKVVVDRFTDKREIGRVLIGGSMFKQLEITGGFRGERVRIDQGLEPNRLNGSVMLAGLTFRLNGDSLDNRDFPRSGTALRIQVDKRSRSLGSDLDYSKGEAEYQRYFSISPKSTVRLNTSLGYSRGPVPFFDLFFVGGYSFSQVASRQFLGLKRDELAPRQMAILGASYRRLLFSHGLSFLRRGYLTGIYNGIFFSDRQTSPYNFDLLHGAGLGLAVDTIVGPVRATLGWAEGGRINFYFTFGPSF